MPNTTWLGSEPPSETTIGRHVENMVGFDKKGREGKKSRRGGILLTFIHLEEHVGPVRLPC
ncbi:transcription-repair coupling factor [Sesbania bispinosa]|nr:transcription-repair coupling factor [Sesbania bispinosa]